MASSVKDGLQPWLLKKSDSRNALGVIIDLRLRKPVSLATSFIESSETKRLR
jgi:hypothetical protein